ncbi:carcinoembryonic antigen-related cell adhesion molecule 3-like isoform X4 [Cervus canadensis]|uniref:carcinoembryonic antigen-related cell adhesion molecule 3-like isoform X4 n=1 Tax=Cervus canadensis TaxID=1574408 RepID=UPI001CA3760F|nr:carcinoembryonic antigen-related cell adhesion molecule 3-like isoform X4 [Cervus canadensis]
MEPPSGPARRRCAPCNRVLLSASLLTFWTPPTTTQLTIETVPPLAAEGSNVLLHAHNVTEKTLRYSWYREERVETIQLIASYGVATNLITNGPEHSGRETLYPNGTLLIQNITQKDTGSYTLLILKFDLQTGQTGHLHVHHKPTPESSSDLSAGAIVGIVAVVALIAALMYFLYIRETRRESRLQQFHLVFLDNQQVSVSRSPQLNPLSSLPYLPLFSLLRSLLREHADRVLPQPTDDEGPTQPLAPGDQVKSL